MTTPEGDARDDGTGARDAGGPGSDAEFAREFEAGFREAGGDPDIGFSLGFEEAAGSGGDSASTAETVVVQDSSAPHVAPSEPARPASPGSTSTGSAETASADDPVVRAQQLVHQLSRELAALGPQGWVRLEAVFTLTTQAELVQVAFTNEQQDSIRVQAPDSVVELARSQRRLSAQLSEGPWWRLLLSVTRQGELTVDYDYGDEPFPPEQLFSAEVYRADLEVFPRASLPVWLAAYLHHGERQSRTPRQAFEQARADRAAGIRATVSERDFPAFPTLWARWAVLSAAFVAVGSEWGPRILPSLGWFEGSRRSGCSLYVLPGGQAVFSGGVWNAPALDATYNAGEPMPEFFRGAPEWVSNPVLTARAGNGLMSFCYWWDGSAWYRGDSPSADQLADAVPGVWTAGTVAQVITGLVHAQPTEAQRAAVADLVSAAEVGLVTRRTLEAVFGADTADIDAALFQLRMAGVASTAPDPLPETLAVQQVRDFINDLGLDTTGYPLDELRAERIEVGWMVYVPTPPGEIAIGRAIFYIADDGVVEQSSSSVAPSVYIADFRDRFHLRHGGLPV